MQIDFYVLGIGTKCYLFVSFFSYVPKIPYTIYIFPFGITSSNYLCLFILQYPSYP